MANNKVTDEVRLLGEFRVERLSKGLGVRDTDSQNSHDVWAPDAGHMRL